MRLAISALIVVLATALTPSRGLTAGGWSASLEATSDYLVRGISRSDGHPALQGDLRGDTAHGLAAGVSLSTVKIAPSQPRNVEASAFAGWTFSPFGRWEASFAVSHYDYLQRPPGAAHYDYNELSLDLAPLAWLAFDVRYSPNTPRYVNYLVGLVRTGNRSAEMNLAWPLTERLTLRGGVGRAAFSGPGGTAYSYWSGGGRYDLGAWSASLTVIDTSPAARTLYATAAAGRWSATLMRRF